MQEIICSNKNVSLVSVSSKIYNQKKIKGKAGRQLAWPWVNKSCLSNLNSKANQKETLLTEIKAGDTFNVYAKLFCSFLLNTYTEAPLLQFFFNKTAICTLKTRKTLCHYERLIFEPPGQTEH